MADTDGVCRWRYWMLDANVTYKLPIIWFVYPMGKKLLRE